MYSPAFYAACTAGGILSCGLTHMTVTPIDLVKCNMQVLIRMLSCYYKHVSKLHIMLFLQEQPIGCEDSGAHSYRALLGIFQHRRQEGIIGKMASLVKHKWICVGEMNSKLLLEYPEELRLQVAAGIKTILLMPVLPLGVVQLGSLHEGTSNKVSLSMTPKTRLPKQGEMLLSVRGSPQGVYKKDNLEAIAAFCSIMQHNCMCRLKAMMFLDQPVRNRHSTLGQVLHSNTKHRSLSIPRPWRD